MRSLAISSYTTPDNYDVMDLPTPTIESPDEVLVKVHAASINPADVHMASGIAKLMQSASFPHKIGFDLSGEVCKVGKGVTKFKPGDEVYGVLKMPLTGSVSEYAVPHQDTIALKPSTLTHVEAASLPIVAVTSIQAFDQAVARMGSLKGKTLFIPAALSGTGSIAIQLAKSVYGASKVITTASTSKIPKLTERLGHGMVDQVIDYTMQDPLKEITHGSVDLMIDTIGGSLSFLPLLKPKAGLIISFSTIPSGTAALQHFPQLPFYIRYLMDLGHWYYKWRVGRWKVEFNTTLGDINFEDLDRLRIWFDEGAKVKPVVGRTVRLDDLEGVRAGCNEVYKGHGGIGKFVIEI